MITNAEIDAIVQAGTNKTDEAAIMAVEWAVQTRIDQNLLDLLLKGLVSWDVQGDELVFAITPKGTEAMTQQQDTFRQAFGAIGVE